MTTDYAFSVTKEIPAATTELSFDVTTEKTEMPMQPTTGEYAFSGVTTDKTETEKPMETTEYSIEVTTGRSETPGSDLTTGRSETPANDMTTGFDMTTDWSQSTDEHRKLTTGVSIAETDMTKVFNEYPDLTTGVSVSQKELTTEGHLVDDNKFIIEGPSATKKVMDILTTKPPMTTTKEYTDCVHGFRQAADDLDSSSIQTGGKFGGYFLEADECRQQCQYIQTIKCTGFMFEPESAGKCTLFTYIFNGYDTSDESSSSLWFLC